VDQCLQLPISVTIVDSGKAATPWMLPFTLESVVEQPLKTGALKINPYQAFDPLPALAKMILDTDRWTEVQTVWNSSTTRRFSTTSSSVLQPTLSNSVVISSQTEEAATMRPIPQKFTIDGFKPGENVTILFDGIEIEEAA
jgi:hypothetical protein